MANLKDLIKKALDEKNGVQSDDGHDATKAGKAEKTTKKKGSAAPAKKPSARVTGRGR